MIDYVKDTIVSLPSALLHYFNPASEMYDDYIRLYLSILTITPKSKPIIFIDDIPHYEINNNLIESLSEELGWGNNTNRNERVLKSLIYLSSKRFIDMVNIRVGESDRTIYTFNIEDFNEGMEYRKDMRLTKYDRVFKGTVEVSIDMYTLLKDDISEFVVYLYMLFLIKNNYYISSCDYPQYEIDFFVQSKWDNYYSSHGSLEELWKILISEMANKVDTPSSNNYNSLIISNIENTNPSKGELEIFKFLTNKNIYFLEEVSFAGCTDKNMLRFDFAILTHGDKPLLIEYDGRQHYEPVEAFGGVEGYNQTRRRDNIKNKYCKEHDIPLLRLRYDEDIFCKLTQFIEEYDGYTKRNIRRR